MHQIQPKPLLTFAEIVEEMKRAELAWQWAHYLLLMEKALVCLPTDPEREVVGFGTTRKYSLVKGDNGERSSVHLTTPDQERRTLSGRDVHWVNQ